MTSSLGTVLLAASGLIFAACGSTSVQAGNGSPSSTSTIPAGEAFLIRLPNQVKPFDDLLKSWYTEATNFQSYPIPTQISTLRNLGIQAQKLVAVANSPWPKINSDILTLSIDGQTLSSDGIVGLTRYANAQQVLNDYDSVTQDFLTLTADLKSTGP